MTNAQRSVASQASPRRPARCVGARAGGGRRAGRREPCSSAPTPTPCVTWAWRARQYSVSAVLPRVDPGVHDRHGVRMRRIRGVLYDFPRGQATYGLLNLSSYRVTDDTFYLDRAVAQAQRLRGDRVVAGEAWYYPNRPSKHRHGNPDEFIAAPYYSALAQGRVLMFFSRLAEVTGDATWRDAADHTFASFLRTGPRSDGPYIDEVDSRGCLWLQEWPWPGMRPDDTLQRAQLGGVRRVRVLAPDEGRDGAGGVPGRGDDLPGVRRLLPRSGVAQLLLPGSPPHRTPSTTTTTWASCWSSTA